MSFIVGWKKGFIFTPPLLELQYVLHRNAFQRCKFMTPSKYLNKNRNWDQAEPFWHHLYIISNLWTPPELLTFCDKWCPIWSVIIYLKLSKFFQRRCYVWHHCWKAAIQVKMSLPLLRFVSLWLVRSLSKHLRSKLTQPRAGNNSRSSDIVRPNFEYVQPISHFDQTWYPNISSTQFAFPKRYYLSMKVA